VKRTVFIGNSMYLVSPNAVSVVDVQQLEAAPKRIPLRVDGPFQAP
jgi:uncharacterized secreted protein with C-terminal beta-propeller domain